MVIYFFLGLKDSVLYKAVKNIDRLSWLDSAQCIIQSNASCSQWGITINVYHFIFVVREDHICRPFKFVSTHIMCGKEQFDTLIPDLASVDKWYINIRIPRSHRY